MVNGADASREPLQRKARIFNRCKYGKQREPALPEHVHCESGPLRRIFDSLQRCRNFLGEPGRVGRLKAILRDAQPVESLCGVTASAAGCVEVDVEFLQAGRDGFDALAGSPRGLIENLNRLEIGADPQGRVSERL